MRVNLGYAVAQLQKALAAAGESASDRVQKWQSVIAGLLDGSLRVGSRTPLSGTPPWVTPEVVHGGFATGGLAADGPLQQHERERLSRLGPPLPGTERSILNLYFAGDDGRAELKSMLESGTFRIQVREEAALLVATWLLGQGEAERAAVLLETIMPWFDRLRFYPMPHAVPLRSGRSVYVRTAGETVNTLRAVRPQAAVQAMRETILVWTPLYDRAVALFLETVEGDLPNMRRDAAGTLIRAPNGQPIVEGGWPCREFPDGWRDRTELLLDEYLEARKLNQLCRKPDKPKENFARLRTYLATCASSPSAMMPRDVGVVRKILASYVAKRGAPGSEQVSSTRTAQRRNADAPSYRAIAQVVADRLASFPVDEGVSDVAPLVAPLSAMEASRLGSSAEISLPASVAAKARRCLEAPVDELVQAGLVPSSEVLAWTLPLLTARVRAEAVSDPKLRRIYEGIYLSFRRRRSLLLLDLESQVRLNELPWVAAIEPWVGSDDATQTAARKTLTETTVLAIENFPHSIFPNRLIKELRALAQAAALNIPLVDELAADIFMGAFSGSFLRAAQSAGDLLRNSVYERYYGLDYGRVLAIDDLQKDRFGTATSAGFAALCQELAGEFTERRWSVARHGALIEQEQILTTNNLASLWKGLELGTILQPRLPELANHCFTWVCQRQQIVIKFWQAKLQALKNSAYAWRQMVFFVSMMEPGQVAEFRDRMAQEFAKQPLGFQRRFGPAVVGLSVVLDGGSFGSGGLHAQSGGRRLLGWTAGRPWLLEEEGS